MDRVLTLGVLSRLFLGVALLTCSYFVGFNRLKNREKLRSFECGFEPMRPPQSNFSSKYFSLALLFVRFDLELIFTVPFLYDKWCKLNSFVKVCFFTFFIILLLGLTHEINQRRVDWE